MLNKKVEDQIYVISTLKIKNPTLSDSGNYTCIIPRTLKSKRALSHSSKIFQVKNDKKQHILFVKEGDNFQWVMYFEGYPKNLKHTFYDPYRNALLRKDKRVSTSYVYEDGKLSLTIKRVTAEDFGNYSVKLEAPNGSYDENYAILIVNATPKVEFGDTPSFASCWQRYLYHRPSSLHSQSTNANRMSSGGSIQIAQKALLPHKLEKDTGPLNRYKSVVSLRPSTSGELLCEVRNDLGFNSTRMYLNVSDKTAPFLVKVRTENGLVNLTRQGTSKTIEVIEGDSIDLECSSLNFLFDKLTFNYSGNVFSCDTELSSARCSRTENISLGNNGSYKCMAENRVTKAAETISFRISILGEARNRAYNN
ncbi:hypothetical protein Avbf_09410 [Armadillidium vulgare]|nr:hypothetical protein Avbf_09410 [Armadillidium vulgare]